MTYLASSGTLVNRDYDRASRLSYERHIVTLISVSLGGADTLVRCRPLAGLSAVAGA
jgi:hypothetical protein